MKETVRDLMGARKSRLRDKAVSKWPSGEVSGGTKAKLVASRSDRAGALTDLVCL